MNVSDQVRRAQRAVEIIEANGGPPPHLESVYRHARERLALAEAEADALGLGIGPLAGLGWAVSALLAIAAGYTVVRAAPAFAEGMQTAAKAATFVAVAAGVMWVLGKGRFRR